MCATCIFSPPRTARKFLSIGVDRLPHIPRGSICCPPGHVPWSGVISAGERRVVDVASHRAMVSENRSKLLTEKTQSHDGSRPVCLAQPACGVKVVETARVIHRHQATPKSRSERLASSGWQG